MISLRRTADQSRDRLLLSGLASRCAHADLVLVFAVVGGPVAARSAGADHDAAVAQRLIAVVLDGFSALPAPRGPRVPATRGSRR